MFNLTSAHRYFLCNEPTDMRKGFDGLSGLVQTYFNSDPMNGSVYVFLNKNRNLIKLLHWENGGFAMYYKRLERGQFERPTANDSTLISWSTLMLIVEGISLSHIRKKERFNSPKTAIKYY
ncbi:MAG TPA: IS66 family insertion sequence hypothetical protein [Flavobacteriales bacterium]|jgi:transposase|nr:IS66 family insertion sequence hypothetical protein [Flavobacteriales bacterium]